MRPRILKTGQIAMQIVQSPITGKKIIELEQYYNMHNLACTYHSYKVSMNSDQGFWDTALTNFSMEFPRNNSKSYNSTIYHQTRTGLRYARLSMLFINPIKFHLTLIQDFWQTVWMKFSMKIFPITPQFNRFLFN